jgi:hypothetical protein
MQKSYQQVRPLFNDCILPLSIWNSHLWKLRVSRTQLFGAAAIVFAAIFFGYPSAFVVEHGWHAASVPSALQPIDAQAWFIHLFDWGLNVRQIVLAYWHMAWGEAQAFPGGGRTEVAVIATETAPAARLCQTETRAKIA